MNILLLEPYYTGSHAAWAQGYAKHSKHNVQILSLKGQFWKWRMHGGAITLAQEFMAARLQPDLILASDMLDVTTFLALTRSQTAKIPVALYCHENQLAYPWSPSDRDVLFKRDAHYGFINYSSALAADAVFFNSSYNMHSFLAELPRFLKHFPDYNELETINTIAAKSSVLYPGLELTPFDQYRTDEKQTAPVILWNHRWEFDKNPDDFFKALTQLADEGLEFGLLLLGENFSANPAVFAEFRQRFGKRILHYGYVENKADYVRYLWQADIIPVTSRHDFFGISVMEAIYCGCFPLLPVRLAYPELIPAAQHKLCFYESFSDLVNRLRRSITEIEQTRKYDLRFIAAPYSWGNMAPCYDNMMETVAVKIK